MKRRSDDFNQRRKHLENLSDKELYDRFWELAGNIVDPMIELGRKSTTPSIERSVLLRMGFSSLEAKPIVDEVIQRGLVGKGAGNIVYRLSKEQNISIREAGVMLINGSGWDIVENLFKKEGASC